MWVLPWRRDDGYGPLRDTLALTILGGDPALAARALREPTIRTVHLGPLPTFAAAFCATEPVLVSCFGVPLAGGVDAPLG